ncbi:MAG: hypothetical protein R3274_10170 [Desulfobacterales bacterium]|nr:hypothetical protein [Desulfobacterales bacterium]
MFYKFNIFLALAVLILTLIMLCGCATPGPAKSTATTAPPAAEVASSVGWWYARFHISWPEEEPVEWYWDLMIADRVISPVLAAFNNDLHLWRFHRRAVRDETGHQFSFLFYASAETAYQVFTSIRANELLAEMKGAGVVIQDFYDVPTQVIRPRIEDTSDTSWPLAIQKSWPYYIMGVSQMWLNLISETAAEMPKFYSPLSLQENAQQYKEIDAAIDDLWEQNGQHAFLHHLGGLFGYKPILFREKRMLKF